MIRKANPGAKQRDYTRPTRRVFYIGK